MREQSLEADAAMKRGQYRQSEMDRLTAAADAAVQHLDSCVAIYESVRKSAIERA